MTIYGHLHLSILQLTQKQCLIKSGKLRGSFLAGHISLIMKRGASKFTYEICFAILYSDVIFLLFIFEYSYKVKVFIQQNFLPSLEFLCSEKIEWFTRLCE